MNPTKLQQITLSLAAMFQAGAMAQALARTGECDERAFHTLIESILKLKANSFSEVYASEAHLRIGLETLIRILSKIASASDAEISRYVIAMTYLERKFIRQQAMQKTLTRRIEHAISQVNYFSIDHPTVMSNLADAFVTTLGSMRYRIHIIGSTKFLQREDIISKIRVALLAGVRAVVLWRQMGGSKWQLIFQRKNLVKTAQQLLLGLA